MLHVRDKEPQQLKLPALPDPFVSGDTTTQPPDAEPTHKDGQTEKISPSHTTGTSTSSWRLVYEDYSELVYAGSCAPALEAVALTEEDPAMGFERSSARHLASRH